MPLVLILFLYNINAVFSQFIKEFDLKISEIREKERERGKSIRNNNCIQVILILFFENKTVNK